MANVADRELSDLIRNKAQSLSGSVTDYAPLSALAEGKKIIMLGEATHGTHDFYHERALITKWLINNHGFNAVVIEGDWPDAYRVNRYVKADDNSLSALQALEGFKRFPSWMWCNTEVLDFVKWLYAYNRNYSNDSRIGFYGLDLYSMHSSMAAVINYLDAKDPEAAKRARMRYACFDHFGMNPHNYAYATNYGGIQACEDDVIQQLRDIRSHADEYLELDGRLAADEFFYAEQNAKLVKNAEKYYRTMFQSDVSSWNLRDRHMFDTLQSLDLHITKLNGQAKIVVWAHNSHVGDARATEMGRRGEFNFGELARKHYMELAANLGFTTFSGTVTASVDWDEPGQRRSVREALPGSYESLLHQVGIPAYMLKFNESEELSEALAIPRLERAIGVIYRPDTERMSHYFLASLSNQFDAIIHIDETRALQPIDLDEHWSRDEEPETYPFGL